MSVKLRDLIKTVRQCKTAAEERAIIAKESSAIRTAIKEGEDKYRLRNVAKLLYIQMMGYSTHFAHMECMKLIVSQSFADKRMGYLGLMLLLDERQEVLMLVTNSLQNDINHANQYVVGLGLCALANISSVSIARDLAPTVVKLLGSSNPYIRKKAGLCAVRIVKKCPELMEQFVGKIRALLGERNHGVLITGITLMIELIDLDKSNAKVFRKMTPHLVKILKNLVLSGYAPDHDVSGVTDPFLQVKLLHSFRLLAKGDAEASDVMNDILAQVATNTENSRNVGNAILYECVQTIMSIESGGDLRVLAINILGRFLLNRDNNIRYVALNSLKRVVTADNQAVQRHRNTIVECLKDHDISIRRRALDLVYALVNEQNIKGLMKELLTFLLTSDLEFRADMTAKICLLTESHSPSPKFHFDTILRVMSISGDHIPDEVISNTVNLIVQHPDLQSYCVGRLYRALCKDINKQPLVQVGFWAIGEYGENLVDTQEDAVPIPDILQLADNILKHANSTPFTKEIVLTALLKLTDRIKKQNIIPDIISRIEPYRASLCLELQQRSCEFTALLKIVDRGVLAQLLEKVPPLEEPEEEAAAPSQAGHVANNVPAPASNNVMDLLGGVAPVQQQQTAPAPGGGLMDLLGVGAAPAASPASPAAVSIQDLLGGSPAPPVAASVPVQAGSIPPYVAFNKGGLVITFTFVKHPTDRSITLIKAEAINQSPTPFENFVIQAAVPLYMQIQISPATGTLVPSNSSGNVQQQFKIQNNSGGEKPTAMKLRLEFNVNGRHIVQDATLADFPPGV